MIEYYYLYGKDHLEYLASIFDNAIENEYSFDVEGSDDFENILDKAHSDDYEFDVNEFDDYKNFVTIEINRFYTLKIHLKIVTIKNRNFIKIEYHFDLTLAKTLHKFIPFKNIGIGKALMDIDNQFYNLTFFDIEKINRSMSSYLLMNCCLETSSLLQCEEGSLSLFKASASLFKIEYQDITVSEREFYYNYIEKNKWTLFSFRVKEGKNFKSKDIVIECNSINYLDDNTIAVYDTFDSSGIKRIVKGKFVNGSLKINDKAIEKCQFAYMKQVITLRDPSNEYYRFKETSKEELKELMDKLNEVSRE